jgi:hypothetical protein
MVDEIIGFGNQSCDWEYCIWASGLGFEGFYNKWLWGLSSEKEVGEVLSLENGGKGI